MSLNVHWVIPLIASVILTGVSLKASAKQQCPTYDSISKKCQEQYSFKCDVPDLDPLHMDRCKQQRTKYDAIYVAFGGYDRDVQRCVSNVMPFVRECQKNTRANEGGLDPFVPPGGDDDNHNGTGGDSGTAGYSMQDLSSEVTSCNSSSQEAYKCCGDPVQCGASSYMPPSTNDPEGIKQYCEQMRYASNAGRSANANAAGVCYSKHTSCSDKCLTSLKKWQDYLPKCKSPTCNLVSVQQAITIFQSNDKGCKELTKTEKLLLSQSSENYQNAQASQLCVNQATQQNPKLASTPPQPQDEQPPGPSPTLEFSCSKYPNSSQCINSTGPGNLDSGDSLTPSDDSGSLSMDNFNTDTGSEGLPQFPQYGNYEPKPTQGTAIQNGGGGFIGSGAAAGTGFEGTAAAAGNIGKDGASTDILHGEGGSGGYSSASAGGEPNAAGGFSGYGSNGGSSYKKKYGGFDLKAYLPGGAKDPRRKIASANGKGTGHPDIAPMGVSMFKRISDHYALMCKLKQFMGCE